ncbi:MAG: 2-hydroxyacyl-CoA dehydratase [Sedimentisphaerales bacterium]|nr:2-hydroxyacyl-CoA dehydratase [Sedimentisphaerales bacterium]
MKKVLYTCPYVPAEWVAAHGLQPCRIIPVSAAAGSAVDRLEGLCPYVRGFINEIAAEKETCGIVATTVCDQMRRGFDLIVRRCESPAFLMNVPSTWQTVAAQKLYIGELKRLGGFLVRLGGRLPTDEQLAEVMLKYDAARRNIFSAKEKLSAGEFAEAIASFSHNGPGERIDDSADSEPVGCGVPLAIIGGPMMINDFDILRMAEQFGGRIVLNATETGERGFCSPFDRRSLRENPLMELAAAYFGGIPDASRRPNSELYRWLERELATRGVRGIIFHRNVFCDIWHAELSRLKDFSGLPVLDIDSTGESESYRQRNSNRIRAFLEMLT